MDKFFLLPARLPADLDNMGKNYTRNAVGEKRVIFSVLRLSEYTNINYYKNVKIQKSFH